MGHLLNIPEQKCMQNLERLRQSSLLIKIPNALFLLSPSNAQKFSFLVIFHVVLALFLTCTKTNKHEQPSLIYRISY